jgi:hypothetical protein
LVKVILKGVHSNVSKISFVNIYKNNSKPIILFGSGNIALKTIRKLRRENISFIVDNSNNLQETTYAGRNVSCSQNSFLRGTQVFALELKILYVE